jgi:putative glutamine amidotransferase
MTDSPLIAISTGRTLPRFHELYLKAVADVGGSAVFIGPDTSVKEAVRRFAGFLIPGGKDIDPSIYNEDCIPELDLEDEERVHFDLSLMEAVTDEKLPVLGICYGMQLMNVASGGTLYQDIGREAVDHGKGIHGLEVVGNPFIETGKYEVNSSHHQAVKKTGKGLSVIAFSPDGIIEAFCSRDYRFHMGVQWHPERMSNRISKIVFSSLVEACSDSK